MTLSLIYAPHSLGKVDPGSVTKVVKEVTEEELARQERVKNRPSLDEILNLHDFEAIAKETLPAKAWAYYSSAADDEITNRENHLAYQRIWFRPRVMRDVSKVDWSTTILGHKSSMPVYITATALGKLGHPEGEVLLTRAAAKHGIIQMIPTLASCSFDEIVDAAKPGQVQFMQLADLVSVPIILKGVQCWEDALLALETGCQGIVLSNHGGRQLDTSRSGIEVLEEVVTKFKERSLWPCPHFEIYVDGGVRRATDVLKAVALGATAVGVGRPFLYAYSAYGQEGIDKALQILHDEMEMNMRLLGARTISEVVPEMVDARHLSSHSAPPSDELYLGNYDRLRRAAIKAKL
ncbi:hypothetical protein FRC18_002310 [Serendipita sp. 400]|nr:hypothetical protein FRC18_002310 [Serendipita sp. 400]